MPTETGSWRARRAIGLRVARLVLLALWFPGCSSSPDPQSDRDAGSDAGDTNHCSIDLHLDVLEGEALVQDVRCPDAAQASDDIELESLPSGASFDARSSELHWTPELDQAGAYLIEVRAQAGRKAGTIAIDVVDNFGVPENVPPVDPAQYLREYGLPVVHVMLSADVNDDTHEPATILYQGHTFSGAFAKYRGATSRKYPKRSYTLKFDKSDPFIDRARGFEGAQRIVLTTTFDDNSYLRQRLAYAMWNRASASHIPIHAFNAVVFIDGEYNGLYVVSDIDDDFLDDAGVFGHANLYKAFPGLSAIETNHDIPIARGRRLDRRPPGLNTRCCFRGSRLCERAAGTPAHLTCTCMCISMRVFNWTRECAQRTAAFRAAT